MATLARIIQSNLTGGEYSNRVRGRIDLREYYNGCLLMQNMLPRIQGGAVRRSGSRYVAEVRDSADTVRIVEFSYSTEQNYVIEFGDGYARFYRSRSQVTESAKNITAITQANPASVTITSHGYSTGDQIYINGVVGMTELNGLRFTITSTGANTFTLDGIDSSAYTAYSSGGTAEKIYQITTPWADDELVDLKFTQSADILYVVHPDYAPRQISRTSDTSWSIAEVDFSDGPYLDINTTATTLAPAATSGTGVNLTASAALFASTDVGRKVRILIGGTWGWATIASYSSSTLVTIDIESAFGGTTATVNWRLGAWSDTTGWPENVTFFQERLTFGANADYPATVWGSKSADFINFAPSDSAGTVTDAHAITFTIADSQVNAIRSLIASENTLIINTSSAVHRLYGGNSAGVIIPVTPTNIAVSRELDYGMAAQNKAMRIGGTTYFIGQSKRSVRAISYNANIRALIAPRQEVLAEHILKPEIVDSTYQKEIEQIAWYLRSDGVLVGNTVESDREINAWHRQVIGGTDATIESIACIPNPLLERGYDVWMVVSRTINGATKQYIEYFETLFDADYDIQRDGVYVDSSLTYNGFLSGTLTPGATTGSAVTFTASASVFSSSDVGSRLYKYNSDNERIASATIVGYSSATVVTADIDLTFDSTSAIASGYWALAKNSFSGLDHLEGETIQVCADGAVLANKTVSSGAFTTDSHYAIVHAGLGFNSIIQSMPFEVQGYGTTQGLIKRIEKVFVGVIGTSIFKYGPNADSLLEHFERDGVMLMDAPPPLKTEIKTFAWPDGYDKEKTFYFLQDQPLPFEISFVATEVRLYG